MLELEREKAQRLLGFSGTSYYLLELAGAPWITYWRVEKDRSTNLLRSGCIIF
jgi:hypothetical protein